MSMWWYILGERPNICDKLMVWSWRRMLCLTAVEWKAKRKEA